MVRNIFRQTPNGQLTSFAFIPASSGDNSRYVADDFFEDPVIYTLSVSPAAFLLTGIAAGLKVGRKTAVVTGTYNLTGVAASLRKSYYSSISPGSFALSGVNAGITAARILSAVTGSFNLTGVSSQLVYGRYISVVTGTYNLTGVAALLKYDRLLPVVAGTYALNGISIGLSITRLFSVATGSFTLTGVNVILSYVRKFSVSKGTFIYTGKSAILLYNPQGNSLEMDEGMYVYFNITPTDYVFQLKDGAGGNIGAPVTFTRKDYKIEKTTGLDYITIQPQTVSEGTFPPAGQYPRNRTVILKTP